MSLPASAKFERWRDAIVPADHLAHQNRSRSEVTWPPTRHIKCGEKACSNCELGCATLILYCKLFSVLCCAALSSWSSLHGPRTVKSENASYKCDKRSRSTVHQSQYRSKTDYHAANMFGAICCSTASFLHLNGSGCFNAVSCERIIGHVMYFLADLQYGPLKRASQSKTASCGRGSAGDHQYIRASLVSIRSHHMQIAVFCEFEMRIWRFSRKMQIIGR